MSREQLDAMPSIFRDDRELKPASLLQLLQRHLRISLRRRHDTESNCRNTQWQSVAQHHEPFKTARDRQAAAYHDTAKTVEQYELAKTATKHEPAKTPEQSQDGGSPPAKFRNDAQVQYGGPFQARRTWPKWRLAKGQRVAKMKSDNRPESLYNASQIATPSTPA